MTIQFIPPSPAGTGMRVGVVQARFNEPVCQALLKGTLAALKQHGVSDEAITVVTVPGALEIALALQQIAQTGFYDCLVALGAVIRGETYHFEIVANESASGLTQVSLEFGMPIGNGILTTETEAQAMERAEQKGFEAAEAALELANIVDAFDDETMEEGHHHEHH